MDLEKLHAVISSGLRVNFRSALVSKLYPFVFVEPPLVISNPEVLEVTFRSQPRISESLSMQMTGLASATVTRPTRQVDLNESLSMQMTGLVSGTVTRPVRNVSQETDNALMAMPVILGATLSVVAIRTTAETDNITMIMPQILEVTLT